MTAKYELTKRYHSNKEIKVTKESLVDFISGNRDTLEHIVYYHHQKYVVILKPPYKFYKYYKIEM